MPCQLWQQPKPVHVSRMPRYVSFRPDLRDSNASRSEDTQASPMAIAVTSITATNRWIKVPAMAALVMVTKLSGKELFYWEIWADEYKERGNAVGFI